MGKRLLFLIILYFAVILQVSIGIPVASLGWDIDIVLIVLILISAKTGRGESILWALIVGLALDSFDPAALGGHMVAKSTAIYVLSYLTIIMNLEQPIYLALAVFILTLIEHLIFRLFTPLINNYFWVLLRYDLPSVILTTIVGFIVLLVALKIGVYVPAVNKED